MVRNTVVLCISLHKFKDATKLLLQPTNTQIKRGGKLYFRKSDLEQWLSKGHRKTNDDVVDKVNANLSKRKNRAIPLSSTPGAVK